MRFSLDIMIEEWLQNCGMVLRKCQIFIGFKVKRGLAGHLCEVIHDDTGFLQFVIPGLTRKISMQKPKLEFSVVREVILHHLSQGFRPLGGHLNGIDEGGP